MTREEAIEIINRENDPNNKEVWEVFPEYREALDMAIKALEQELCDDAISRQAAIDEISDYNNDLDYTTNELYDRIKRMSPVNPQPKYEDIAKAFQLGLALGFGKKYDEMDRVIDEIKKVITPQLKTDWIPVSERLPEENKTVIASTKYGVYPETKYTKEYGWEWAYEAGADYWKELEDVTAWMPLPTPFKLQESEVNDEG